MSTRAAIGFKVEDKYHLIYCHYDGYPEHVGKILKQYYSSQERAEYLVHGGLSIRGFNDDGSIERFNDPDDIFFEALTIEEGLSGFDYLYEFVDNKWVCYGHARTPTYSVTTFEIPTN